MFSTIISKTFKTVRLVAGVALILTATGSFAQAGGGGGVPELDPTSLASAITLMAGGVLMLTDKVRAK